MLMIPTTTISTAFYKQLLEGQKKLVALEAGGVDNWDGYDFAMEEMEE